MFRAATVPGIPPSELSPRKNRVPLSRPLAPLQLSTGVQECTVLRLITSGFTDSHAFAQLPGSPSDYELPFDEPKLASRSFWARDSGITPFRQLHLLRSFTPLANPFATTLGCPSAVGRCSPGLFLFEAFSVHVLGPRPTRSSIEHDPGFATSWDQQPRAVG